MIFLLKTYLIFIYQKISDILFYSKNNKNALVMSKIDNEYINLVIPAYSLKNKGVSVISTLQRES